MKKITILVATLLLAGSLAHASEFNVFSGNPNPNHHGPVDYRDAEPVAFLERGIEFMVFPNGELDFNTEPSLNGGSNSGTYYRGTRGVNATHGAPGVHTNRGTRVDHDAKGRVRRVGNVFINYDYTGRVKRIGTVYMDYNRYGLSYVGYLRLLYDNYGRITGSTGYVNQANRSYVYDPCADVHTYNGNGSSNGYGNNGNPQDNQYYRRPATANKK